jgi:DNA-binding transcriptional regulator YiaG
MTFHIMEYSTRKKCGKLRGMYSRKAPTPKPEEIASLRYRHDLTQVQFGELLYVGVRSVQHWESGASGMHPALWELAQIKLGEKIIEKS